MKRRNFLKAAAVGSAAAAASVSMKARRASAVPLFGDVPADHASIMLPKENQVTSILECFMYGGVTPWEGFYCVPSYGSDGKSWHQAYPVEFLNAAKACSYSDPGLFTYFADDSGSNVTGLVDAPKGIFLSPFLAPLIARTDITDRMRIVVNRHALEPHEAAIPLTMAGATLGSPSLASLGSHVARYFVDHDLEAKHPAPFSYGIVGSGNFIPTDNILTMLATGLHPGAARPLHIKMNDVARLSTLISRAPIGGPEDRTRYDALLATYFGQYQNRLKFASTGDMLRAPRFGELSAAANSLAHAKDIQELLAPEYLARVGGTACFTRTGAQTIGSGTYNNVPFTQTANYPGMSLKMAAHLLTHPTAPAAHCMVIDTGLSAADGGGGYDTHNETPFTQARNLNNFFSSLLPLVNKPGETDPNKLDLNKTLIILNMEFGRTPGLQKPTQNTGRNHWPYGYTQVYIGGPITQAQRGIYGTIPETGLASVYTTPTENRIAALLAMGIWPFDQSSFSSAQVQDSSSESNAVKSVLRRVLGYTV
ncbi:MAG TPA: DUF1501 domain-containing protein [Polyangiaceae bacterium]|nr:DUF1501 domain-containing protein [Polyangiaceae bacterium]